MLNIANIIQIVHIGLGIQRREITTIHAIAIKSLRSVKGRRTFNWNLFRKLQNSESKKAVGEACHNSIIFLFFFIYFFIFLSSNFWDGDLEVTQ